MDEEKKKKKKLSFIQLCKLVIKKTKLSTLLLIAITFASNTFAWFIYATKVSAGVTAHVNAWDVMFTANDNKIEENVQFTIPSIYPGMEDYTDSVTAYNRGEQNATVDYEIVSAVILGVSYNVDGTTLTSDMLENKLQSDFPFSITMGLTDEVMNPTSGRATFSLNVTWPYESGDDELDTYWGNKAYDFNLNNPGADSIVLEIKISAVQSET